MFARYLVSILLIALGISSPWLVKDWLEWKADPEVKGGFYQKLADFPETVRSRFESSEVVGEGDGFDDGGTGEVEPYPLASRTMRFFQGLIPSDTITEKGINADPRVQSAESELARAASQDVLSGMENPLAKLQLRIGDPVFLRVFKEENELEVWMKGMGNPDYTLFKVYRLRGWSGSLGPKLREGDRQTPEGFYYASHSRLRPTTRHFLGIDLGYPNEYDRSHARTGSGLMIHGGNSEAGAFVLSPSDISEVYALSESALRGGQRIVRIHVFPFRMTDRRMEKEWREQPDWIEFWVNLKEGYDFFENANFPPDVSVDAGEYVFRLP